MNQTPNYQLSQWEATDKVQRVDFNADNAKIDAALKAESDARSAQVSVLNAALNRKGNCRIWTTSYTGTDTYGEDNPTTFTFPGKPLMVVVSNLSSSNCMLLLYGVRDCMAVGTITNNYCYAAWSGNSLFLTSRQGSSYQMNSRGTPYSLVALLAADE